MNSPPSVCLKVPLSEVLSPTCSTSAARCVYSGQFLVMRIVMQDIGEKVNIIPWQAHVKKHISTNFDNT